MGQFSGSVSTAVQSWNVDGNSLPAASQRWALEKWSFKQRNSNSCGWMKLPPYGRLSFNGGTFCQHFSLQNQFWLLFVLSTYSPTTTTALNHQSAWGIPIFKRESLLVWSHREKNVTVTAAVSLSSGPVFLQPLLIGIDPDLLPAAVNSFTPLVFSADIFIAVSQVYWVKA